MRWGRIEWCVLKRWGREDRMFCLVLSFKAFRAPLLKQCSPEETLTVLAEFCTLILPFPEVFFHWA